MKKTVLITGASRGLGYFLARIFAQNNYDVIFHCNKSPVREISGVKVDVIRGDIREKTIISKLAELADKKNIDILINNAGAYLNCPFPQMSDSEVKEILETNLLAPILLIKLIWPIFQRRRSGIIVNINSMAGKVGGDGEAAYCASKYGLKGFSDSIQFDATRDGIRIIDVFLGAMQTGMTEHRQNWEKLIDPVEAADMIFDLCKNYSRMRITEVDVNRRLY